MPFPRRHLTGAVGGDLVLVEPGLIAAVGNLAETAWPLLTVLLLVAGFVRLRGWRRRNWLRTAAWAGAWVAGIVLVAFLAVVAGVQEDTI